MNSPQRTSPLCRSLKAGLISFLLLLGSLSAQAQTRFVSTTGTNSNPTSATSWATSTTDLQGAINASATNDQVWVASGIYKPTTTTGPDSRTISFSMKNGVSILGGFAGSGPTPDTRIPLSSTLSGDVGTVGDASDNSYHVIYNTGLDATALLENFVITGGNANGTFTATIGGGMYNIRSSPHLTNCLFQSNTATLNGGAMYNSSGSGIASPTLINCAFLTNSANEGGAIYNSANNGTASPTLTNCSFVGNSATEGGAIANFRGTGAAREAAQARLAAAGVSNPVLTNCVVFGNGGNKTFWNVNSATVTATYSLFDDSVTGYISDPTNLTTNTTPYASPSSTRLAPGAPAIDTGNSAATGLVGISTDLDNNPRFVGCRVDMGANEFQANTNQALTITNQPAAGSAVCVGGAVTASVGVSGTVTGYQWVRDGALLSPTQTTSTLSITNVQVGDEGSYSVVVIGACNSVTSSAFKLTVNALPAPTLTTINGLGVASTTLTCAQTSLTLTATGGTGGGAFSYTFAGPGIVSQNTSAGTALIDARGTYSVTVINTVTGCSIVTSTTVSSNNTAPGAILSASLSTTLTCVQTGLTLTGSSSGTGSLAYTFSEPSGLIGGSSNTRPVSQSGIYSLTVTNTNTGCYSTTTLTISQNSSGVQSLSLTLSLQSVNCEAPRATLVAAPGASSYRFTGPGTDQTSSANILPVSVAGTYSATALFGGCFAATSLTTGAAPTVLLIGNGTLSCTIPTVSLSVLGSGAGTVFSGPLGSATGIVSQSDGIERTFVNGYLICRTPLPAYAWAIVNQPGVYRVRVVGTNGLESSATITVTGQACPAGGR